MGLSRVKILVVGSTDYDNGDQLAPDFIQACKDVGSSLAKAGVEFVIGSSEANTADRHVMEGAAVIPGTHKVWVYRPRKGDTPEMPACDPTQTKFITNYRRLAGPWEAGILPQLQAADAVLLVGGGLGTTQVGFAAMALGKPAVAIASFHGAAEGLWPMLEPFYERAPRLREEIGNLREKWKPEYADLVVRVFHELIRTGAFQKKTTRAALLILSLNIVLFSIWVWFFVDPPWEWQAAMFPLLAVSAFLGTSLRTALQAILDPSEQKSNEVVIAEFSAGLVLAFALAMLYLAGSFTFTGKFTPFSKQSTVDDYQRVCVGLTLIGIAGGWLLERVAERLTTAFGDSLGTRD